MSWQLPLTVDRESPLPLAVQVRNFLHRSVENGSLRPGTRIPSTRQLALDLGVSRSVVVEAYERLVAEGYLLTKRGSGTTVSEPPSSRVAPTLVSHDRESAEAMWDLRTGTSDIAAFPRQDWIRCVTAVIQDAGRQEFSYAPPAGVPLARHVLTGYLGRVRGVRTRPEDLMLTAGFAQGLALICKVLIDRGHRSLGVEDPGHPGEREFITSSGLRPVGIPVDEDGLRVDLLERSGVRAVLMTPGNHFPTGSRLSQERRERLIAWARSVDGYVLEDDFDGAFLHRSDRQPALQSLAPDRVVYAGSASKILAPALRLGWLAAPSELMSSVEHVRAGWDLGCSGIEQLSLARFIDTGGLDRHQRKMRAEFHKRRGVVRRQVASCLPGARLLGRDSGLQAYLELPAHVDEHALVRAARHRSVLVRGGRFYVLTDTTRPPALVVSYAAVNCAALARSLDALGAAYRDLAGTRKGPRPV
ncbi:PLP-dependent aminotransferase family protein [Streptomyces sp. NBC_01754]|uniref:MocR-like pyridoxine biosynthesis transcription factor PdxR n=1 Tax=Streptomyces sp. NBC_01754 TaxID=2975930 RepID=UPI002DD8670C|nr:PLP-dependent aminotransferase family protein [Streptomyces sp. NBC_01754]WSC93590.1 PLP-dependent aminotransferase family protein [Streptomyces sp. NBC_01754]